MHTHTYSLKHIYSHTDTHIKHTHTHTHTRTRTNEQIIDEQVSKMNPSEKSLHVERKELERDDHPGCLLSGFLLVNRWVFFISLYDVILFYSMQFDNISQSHYLIAVLDEIVWSHCYTTLYDIMIIHSIALSWRLYRIYCIHYIALDTTAIQFTPPTTLLYFTPLRHLSNSTAHFPVTHTFFLIIP